MRLTSVLAASAVLATFACSGSPSGPSDTSGPPSGPSGSLGTMNVRLTDSPYSKAKSVLITFSEVSAHRDGNWTRLPFAGGASTRTCDLKKLENSNQDVLGTGSLNPGSYTMIRLMVQSATIYFDTAAVSPPCAASIAAPAGAKADLPIPSGEVRVNGTFTLTAGAATTLLLDFDGESSINDLGNGNYRMSPVVRLVSVQ